MSDTIRYEIDADIDIEALLRLFAQADWTRSRQARDTRKMLLGTTFHITAWRDNRLIGFLRVLTDRAYRALIEDVIVAENHRKSGIGRKLVALALEELSDVEEVLLGCTEENVSYYAQFEFIRVTHPFMKRVRIN